MASADDARVFSGGADCTIHVWTPPASGLAKPAPPEQPVALTWDSAGAAATVNLATGTAAGAAASSSRLVVLEDGDAWSDDDQDEEDPGQKRRRRR